MSKKYTFTDSEKAQVEQAVKDLETVSCGEIVPYFVGSSDDYAEASWYTSTLLSAFTVVIIGVLSYTWMLPFKFTPLEVSVVAFAAMLVGFLFPLIFSSAKRWIIPKERQLQRVNQRAMQAFLDEKVFQTEERVGILIFVSRLEHIVLVLGDEGISKKVDQADWQHVVEEIITGVKANEIGNGLVKAIALCKDLLLKHGFVRKSTDTNELHDGLRIEE
ncbi:MAG: putative membrane protein [Marinoscillum sp.]|jgi:putative membrane protein